MQSERAAEAKSLQQQHQRELDSQMQQLNDLRRSNVEMQDRDHEAMQKQVYAPVNLKFYKTALKSYSLNLIRLVNLKCCSFKII